MQGLFDYDDSEDSEVLIEKDIIVGGRQMKISAYTLVGAGDGRQNEDTFAVYSCGAELNLAVFDGATSIKPSEQLGKTTGARYISHFLKKKFISKPAENTADLLIRLNKEFAGEISKILSISKFDPSLYPCSAGVVAKIDIRRMHLEITNIMDTWLIAFYQDGTSKLLTVDYNARFDKPVHSLMQYLAKERNISPKEARNTPEVDNALLEMYKARNNPSDGSGAGIINGDINIKQYLKSSSFSLEGVSSILMGSDGLIPPGISLENESDRSLILDLLKTKGFKGLIDLKHSRENSDPNFEKYIRYKMSDDATGICVCM